mgnify:CR=1 FL=1
MSIYQTLLEIGLTSAKTSSFFRKGVRDNPNIDVYRDKSSGVIFIKDHYVGDEEYQSGDYRKEKAVKGGKGLSVRSYELENDCDRRVKDFSPFYVGKDIADFGSGHGDFLYATNHLTKSSVGIELQINFVEELNSNGIRCEESLGSIDNKSIDTFFLFHSFEHLPDPLSILEEIKSKLRMKGKIVIEVPHANDFLISTLKEESFIEFTLWSQHLILHTEHSLRRFLEYAGFQNILIKGIQRYPLSNHLQWISKKRPGGHQSNLALLDTESLSEAYSSALSRIGANDTLVAIADLN